MFKFLMKWIFMDKRARDAAKEMRDTKPIKAKKPVPDATPAEAPPEATGPAEGAAGSGDDERAKLMNLYRQRRQEYEQLDDDVQEKLAKPADDALSGKDKDAS